MHDRHFNATSPTPQLPYPSSVKSHSRSPATHPLLTKPLISPTIYLLPQLGGESITNNDYLTHPNPVTIHALSIPLYIIQLPSSSSSFPLYTIQLPSSSSSFPLYTIQLPSSSSLSIQLPSTSSLFPLYTVGVGGGEGGSCSYVEFHTFF